MLPDTGTPVRPRRGKPRVLLSLFWLLEYPPRRGWRTRHGAAGCRYNATRMRDQPCAQIATELD